MFFLVNIRIQYDFYFKQILILKNNFLFLFILQTKYKYKGNICH